MKAEELRIGNLLSYEGNVVHVSNIGSNGFETTKDGVLYGSCDLLSYDPIDLTEQWLRDFGFGESKIDKSGLFSSDFNIMVEKDVFTGLFMFQYSIGEKSTACFKIKHVHQLQNLYFALTGKELQL